MPETQTAEGQRPGGWLGDNAGWLPGWIGRTASWALVRTIFAIAVIVQWLDPRVHSESLRVRAITAGRLSKNSDKIALLVVYCDGALPVFTRTLVEALAHSDFDLVVVSNGRPDAASRSYLLDRARLLIERANIGRDFGGYKDGIAVVLRRYPQLQKLLLANDSVFYLPQGLAELLAQLEGEGEFIGVSEIFEHHYHVASFLVSFGKTVLDSEAFRTFWRRYRPVSTRRWAILRGEGRLTEALIAAGFRPQVLYRTDALRQRLRECSADRLWTETTCLPVRARQALGTECNDAGAETGATPASAVADQIADAIKLRNQMHYGGFLFRRHLGMPVVKRDLVYRGVFSLDDALQNLGDLEAALLDAIKSDFRARGNPANYRGLRRMFYRHGAI